MMMTAALGVAGAAGTFPLLGWSADAHADEGSRKIVEVTIAGTEDDLDTFVEAMREPLESLGLSVRGSAGQGQEPSGPSPVANATLWIDVRAPDHVEMLVWLGQKGRAVRRSLPRDPARVSRAVVAEDVAYAVRSTLESLLTEVPPPPPPPPPPVTPPPPAPVPVVDLLPQPVVDLLPPRVASASALAATAVSAPPAPPPDGFGLDVAALANLRGVAASTSAVGATGAFDVAFWGRKRWRPSLWITGGFDAPFSSTTAPSGVYVTATITSLRAVADVELAHVGPLRFAGGLGYGADLFRIDTSAPRGLASIGATTFADPTFTGQLVGRARLFDRAGLIVLATLDYDTAPHRYQETIAGTTTSVLAPWTFRPAVFVGLCFRLTGASGCGGAW